MIDEVVSMNVTTTPSVSADNGHHGGLSGTAKDVLFTIQYVLMPLFLLTGLTGNLLTIVTMMSKSFNALASRYILVFLALSDSLFLLTQPFNKLWMVSLLGLDLRALSNTSCKMFFVIYRTSKMTSSWLVVFLCFERFIAIVFPIQMNTIVTKRNTLIAIAVNYVVMFTYNSVWSRYTEVTGGICKPNVPTVGHQIFVVIGISLYSILPIILLSVFTPQIIFRLRRRVANRRAMYSRNSTTETTRHRDDVNKTSFDADSTSANRHESTTVEGTSASSRRRAVSGNVGGAKKRNNDNMIRACHLVLGVMVAYIILVLPTTVFQIAGQLIAQAQEVSIRDVSGPGFAIFKEIANILEQINYAVNFFFYILSCSRFRKRVLEITRFNRCMNKK